MRLTVDAATVAREIGHALRCVAERSTIPILSHLMLIAERNRLTIHATDTDIAYRAVVDAEIAEPGRACVPAKKLSDVVSSLSGPVAISGDADSIELRSGRARLKIAALPATEYPAMPEDGGTTITEIPGSSLVALIRGAAPAMSDTDRHGFAMQGALLVANGAAARLVATDSHRVACATYISETTVGTGRALIAGRAVAVLARIADGESVKVADTDRFIRFECGDRVLHSKKLDGQFPAYERVLSPATPVTIEADVATLTAAIRRVILLATTEIKNVTLDLGPGELKLTGSVSDLGDADDALPVTYASAPVAVTLNASYVLDFLGACPTKTASIGLRDAESAVVLSSGDNLKHVVMPIRP